MRVRMLLHALDRTGPPVLGLSFARWLVRTRPDIDVDVVAFRGGPMADEAVRLGGLTVLLDPAEPWSHDRPDPVRVRSVSARSRHLPPADVMLAVSISAGQCLPYLPDPLPPLATWVVERGEDLHWLDADLGVVERTSRWLAGSDGSRVEIERRTDVRGPVTVAAEFVEPEQASERTVANCRSALGADPAGLLVLGAGIATHRKGPDLFLAAAATSRRRGRRDTYVWLGGDGDEWFGHLVAESRRLDEPVRFFGGVDDVTPWLAAADVLAHPARLDAFPLVALHAALAGTPVVGFAESGGLAEMFGPAALLATFPDVRDLCDLVDDLRDQARRRVAAQAQRDHVIDRYTTDVAAPTVLAALTEVAEAGPTGRTAP